MLNSNAVRDAMVDLVIVMAVESGYLSVFEPAVNDWAPSHADLAHTLREPVSMSTVLMDLCQRLGVDPPEVVRQALCS